MHALLKALGGAAAAEHCDITSPKVIISKLSLRFFVAKLFLLRAKAHSSISKKSHIRCSRIKRERVI